MRSIVEAVCRPAAIRRGALVLACAAAFQVATSPTLSAQGAIALGIRGGVGVDRAGRTVYTGQLEVTEVGGSSSAQVALAGFDARWIDDRQVFDSRRLRSYDYHEEVRVRGGGVVASILPWHRRDEGGPYVALGLGVGPMIVDWRLESATDTRFATPLPGGGTFVEEEKVQLGSMLSVGLGLRVHRHVDFRAQTLALVVPSSDVREELKVVPTFTLTTGLSF
jgi:hypothetical protein